MEAGSLSPLSDSTGSASGPPDVPRLSSIPSSSSSISSSVSSSAFSSSSTVVKVPPPVNNDGRIEKLPWPHFDDKQQQYMSLSKSLYFLFLWREGLPSSFHPFVIDSLSVFDPLVSPLVHSITIECYPLYLLVRTCQVSCDIESGRRAVYILCILKRSKGNNWLGFPTRKLQRRIRENNLLTYRRITFGRIWTCIVHCTLNLYRHSCTFLNFISTGLKPKLRDHYHAHRLSYWNSLIPKLHVPGSTPSILGVEHHLLSDHDDTESYEGIVRDSSISRIRSLLDSNFTTSRSGNTSSSTSSADSGITLLSQTAHTKSLHTSLPSTKNSPPSLPISDQEASQKTRTSSSSPPRDDNRRQGTDSKSINASVSAMFQEGTYSTALSVVIAVGVSLLVLNLLVFAGMFYHKDRLNSNIVHSVSNNPSSINNTGSSSCNSNHLVSGFPSCSMSFLFCCSDFFSPNQISKTWQQYWR